jgi:hypothetical protein
LLSSRGFQMAVATEIGNDKAYRHDSFGYHKRVCSTSEHLSRSVDRKMLFRRIVVQIWAEPSLNLCQVHPLAFAIIGNLITFDFA